MHGKVQQGKQLVYFVINYLFLVSNLCQYIAQVSPMMILFGLLPTSVCSQTRWHQERCTILS